MPKITVKVRENIWKLLNEECKALSLKRDDFLDRVIDIELDYFEKITECDDIGSAWLEKSWIFHNAPSYGKPYELISVSVALSESVIRSIQNICTEKKVPRDAFLDLAIQFISKRILEPAKIIKNPRIDTDIYSRIIAEVDEDNVEFLTEDSSNLILDAIKNWISEDPQLIESMRYKYKTYDSLSINKEYVEKWKLLQGAFDE